MSDPDWWQYPEKLLWEKKRRSGKPGQYAVLRPKPGATEQEIANWQRRRREEAAKRGGLPLGRTSSGPGAGLRIPGE